jgi:hypothetical protein
MIPAMLVSVLLSLVTVVGLTGLLYIVFRLQLRHYETVVCTDLLDRWKRHLEGLTPAERERVASAPPPQVVAAMVELPSPLRLTR